MLPQLCGKMYACVNVDTNLENTDTLQSWCDMDQQQQKVFLHNLMLLGSEAAGKPALFLCSTSSEAPEIRLHSHHWLTHASPRRRRGRGMIKTSLLPVPSTSANVAPASWEDLTESPTRLAALQSSVSKYGVERDNADKQPVNNPE